jgi:hypothetical protein
MNRTRSLLIVGVIAAVLTLAGCAPAASGAGGPAGRGGATPAPAASAAPTKTGGGLKLGRRLFDRLGVIHG